MKKIIVTTAICTAFFSTLACAQAQQAGQTPQEIAQQALDKVNALDGKIDNVGKTAGNAETKANENEGKIQQHEGKFNDYDQKINGYDQKINSYDEEIKKASALVEGQRTSNLLIKQELTKAEEAVKEVKANADRVPELDQKIGAAQDNANVLKGRVDGHDEKIKNLEEKAGALPDVIAQAQDAQVQATAAKSKAEKAEKEVEKFDKEIKSLRDDIQGAMGAPKGNVMKEMNELRNQTNKGLAKVTALAGLHPLAFDKNNKLSLSVASGSYKSEHALALGGFYQPNRDILLSFGSSVGGNDNAYTFGASVRVGSHSKTAEKQHVSQVAELYAAIAKLQAQVEKQQKEIVQLKRAK
ncbi:YadA-like family protein [Veillonella montpellierensis]|uniref:YadA-like family protein n=1 Tax=Veillonella montpellierensis TaxID=187328 RepID=UPI00056F2716|nr:YadA C-terminal domain-containing protein [Veillonella montpellierensis]